VIKSADEFVALRTSENLEEQHRASDEEASDEVWLEVIERYPDMREWVAHNKMVPRYILEILARDPNRRVRFTVATKNKAGDALLELLSHDEDEGVRQRVACNKKTPTRILESMLEDTGYRIAEIAAKKLAQRKEKEKQK
jgi:hypothetical protein